MKYFSFTYHYSNDFFLSSRFVPETIWEEDGKPGNLSRARASAGVRRLGNRFAELQERNILHAALIATAPRMPARGAAVLFVLFVW